MKKFVTRSMKDSDWPRVRKIYRDGLLTKIATFETAVPGWEKWNADHLVKCRIVVEMHGEVVGWGALKPTSTREVYRGVCEVSIYVDEDHRGMGFGNLLMKNLIKSSEKEGIWTLQAIIFRENDASVKLHEKHGFRVVGFREKIGRLEGKWKDTLLLERRSRTVEPL